MNLANKSDSETSSRKRADVLLVERGLFESRARARAAIEAGFVIAGGKQIMKASETIPADAEISAQLLEARGVGAWTVDMLLMFTLCRADVMPVTDYGVRKGFQVLYRKRSLPTPKQLLKFSSVWQPHRSVASLYLWRIAESAKKPKRPKKKTAQRKTAKKRTLQ